MLTPLLQSNILAIGFLAHVRRVTGLDAQVLSTLLFRGWGVLAGAATVLALPLWLGKIEQGYYYTFASLLALQIFFELGLNQVVVQLVSHDFAHLSVSEDGRLGGDARRLGRLASMWILLRRWYFAAALAFAVLVGAAGAVFFSAKGGLPPGAWLGVWLLMCAATAANLYWSIELTFLEGCGQITKVARLRLAQSIGGYTLLWAALAGGAGLWAVVAVPCVSALCSGYWLKRTAPLLYDLHSRPLPPPSHRIRWRTDIFPLQWRIAVSWISGYFIFQLFTPLTFANYGAVEAGRLGLSLAIFNALLTVGMSWTNAKVPLMAAHVSRGERSALNAVFDSVTKRSLVFTAAAGLVLVLVAQWMSMSGVAAASRIADLPVLLCLALVSVANGFTFAMAAYMRAHKEEPMLWVSLVSGVATLLAALVGIRAGVFAMMLLYAVVVSLLALPWTLKLYLTYRARRT